MVKEFLTSCDVHCYHVSVLCKCLLTNLYTFWSLGIWNDIVGSWCTLCDHSIHSGVFRGKYLFTRLCQMPSEIHAGKWGSGFWHLTLSVASPQPCFFSNVTIQNPNVFDSLSKKIFYFGRFPANHIPPEAHIEHGQFQSKCYGIKKIHNYRLV